MKFKYIVIYKNSSEEFDVGHYQIKVKVTAGVQTVFTFTTLQMVRSYKFFAINQLWYQVGSLY